jgi:hypothetical protein
MGVITGAGPSVTPGGPRFLHLYSVERNVVARLATVAVTERALTPTSLDLD